MQWKSIILALMVTIAPALAAGGAEAPSPQAISPAVMTGVILPRQAVDMAAEIDARIEVIHVQLGEKIARGTVIATLDVKDSREELEMARARLKSAEARERLAVAELAVAADRSKRRAKVPDAWSEQEKADAELDRERAEANVDVAGSEVLLQRAHVGQLERRLESASIRSPFDAMVSERYLEDGAMVEVGTPIMRLISAGELWVRFAVPEALVDSVHLGRSVKVRLPANDLLLVGTIGRMAPEIDTSSHLLTVEGPLLIPDPYLARVRAGMIARVQFSRPGDP